MDIIIDIFRYDFMVKALIVSVSLAIVIPCIAMVVVFKRLSMTGDALSHSSLAGVAIGLVFQFSPILGSIIACLLAAVFIELIRKKMKQYADLAIALVMSTSVALAGIFTPFIKKATNLHSFLFGSIVAISDIEFYSIIIMSAFIFIIFILFYKELFYITYDDESARLAGVRVNAINIMFTFLTALTISIAARTVGTLIVSSFIVVPVACAMQVANSYKSTLIASILFAICFSVIGLIITNIYPLGVGSTMVLVGIVTLILIVAVKMIVKGIRR